MDIPHLCIGEAVRSRRDAWHPSPFFGYRMQQLALTPSFLAKERGSNVHVTLLKPWQDGKTRSNCT